MIKETREDYLRAIYHINEEKEAQDASSIDISKYLKVSKSSVSEMLRKLSKEGLIHLTRYGKIRLTNKGLAESISITRRHRTIEVFLSDILKIRNSSLHEEAHRLEHAFSDESIRSLTKLTKNREQCPHGKPIPNVI